MASGKKKDSERIDPAWPQVGEADDAPVSELVTDRQGAMSPFGDITFPLAEDSVPYVHPETRVNK
ncbi:hypothetical protein [Haloactinomyces albus]|uniref:Uncharacterized protein n=1 Tax=Haloactinomyces albus TaxID=1352928 RepID=A0AAE4CPB4_9ACTN|nr:hypothetical protein [Haloactinomyces albus]MDR7301528.1 hypothetical protein [Haloactinomyces albus]